MNRIRSFTIVILTLGLCAFGAQALVVKPNVGPVVGNPMPNYDQYLQTTRLIDLSPYFSDPDSSSAARLTTPFGAFTVTLDGQQAPATVANFLNYINSGRYFTIDPTNGQRAASFVHRLVNNFVMQGGGFIGTVNPNGSGNVQATQVLTFPPVENEPFISNTRGTIAMAKLSGDSNSATSQWFINLADNSANLDAQNGGFTAFGHVVGNGMSVVDTISGLTEYNFGSPFDSLPVRDYQSPNAVQVPNLVSITEIVPASPLTYSASSDNPGVATVSTSDGNLLVNALQLGTANITVTGYDLDGAGPVSQTFTVNIITAPGRVRNISTRVNFPNGDEALTAGFIVRGGPTKRLVARGIAVPGTDFDNPSIELLGPDGSVIASNDDWQTNLNKQELIDLQIAPSSAKDAAVLVTVPSSDNEITSYTARVRSADGHRGLGLVEIYDVDSQPGSTLRNISTVGPVGTGANVMVGGFIVRGSDPRRVIIRALGPSLTARGVNGALDNPTIELRDANGTVIDYNDDWQTNPNQAEIQGDGLAPEDARESAIIDTLPEGNYTATVAGILNTTGMAQVEVYQVD